MKPFLKILTGLIFAVSQVSFAQLPDFNVQVLNESNGIQTANVNRIIRDGKGFLWVQSARHLQRFDGQNVKRIETSGADLLDVVSDSSGTIYTTTESGIQRYTNDARGFETITFKRNAVFPEGKLNKLEVTPDNSVWANAMEGLYRKAPGDATFRYFPLPGLARRKFYRRIFEQRGFHLFLGDTDTVFSVDTRSRTVRIVPIQGVRAVVPFSEAIVWVTNNLLQNFEVDFNAKTVTRITGLPLTELHSVNHLKESNYLVNTAKGCYKYNRKDGTFVKASLFNSGNELPNDENYADYFDPEGTFWLLCQEGIVFFRPREHGIGWLRGVTKAKRDWNNNIFSMTEDLDDNIWLGTKAGFHAMNLNTGKVRSFESETNAGGRLGFPAVRSLAFDGTNLIICPEKGEPVLFNPRTEKFGSLTYPKGPAGEALRKKMKGEIIAKVQRIYDENFLIVGEETCYIIEKESYMISEKYFPEALHNIQSVVEEPGGNFWMGSYNGLLYVDKNFKTLLKDSGFKPSNVVTSLLIRNDSTVWCGTVGLYEVVLGKNALRKKRIFPQLQNQRIVFLYTDKTGKVWIGADDGLFRYDGISRQLEWFDVWDNVQNTRFNLNAFVEARCGYVFVGGHNGLNYFVPGEIERRSEKLNVSISNVRINQDDSMYLTRPMPLKLDWKENSVEFQYVTAYYRNPQKLTYRYRLIGLDSSWSLNGRNNKVRFSSLSPGNYTFTVAASLDGVTWHKTANPFSFVIEPPIWRRAWFILAGIVVVSGLGYAIFRRRIQHIHQQTALRERISEMEMKALRAQMNPHFIFNCLNSINRYIVKSDNATASLYLTRFSKLIRLILDNSNSKKVLLSNELEAFKLYIEMEGIRFDNKFSYELILADDVFADSIEVPSLIIQPYVENAIWHGLLHKETNGKLTVRISMTDDHVLQCIVEDNGIGRKRAQEFKSKSATSKKSMGMKLTEDRIAILNQYAQTSASVEIRDLVDENNEPAGTEVVIRIPVE